MSARQYLLWFLSVVAAAVAALMAFNTYAEHVILTDPNGPSVQTVSGFERVVKPVWLDSIEPSMVFVGSSRMREGFDPVLIDPTFHVRSFDYGVSSITAYEARRFAEDALAHSSVRTLIVGLDAFSGTSAAQKIGPGFDELRLKVTPDGKPTPRRGLWLFATRTLSGGAAAMHALSLFDLLQLGPHQSAADRPDLFEAYGRMSEARMRRDLAYRTRRVMAMGPWQHEELRALLGDICHRGDMRTILFFPPDHAAMLALYLKNDATGLAAFKAAVSADAAHHNETCRGQVTVFDFLNRNAITDDAMEGGFSSNYLDLVHFRPPVGIRLLNRMLHSDKEESTLGVELVGPEIALR